jgi:hypothetical protein
MKKMVIIGAVLVSGISGCDTKEIDTNGNVESVTRIEEDDPRWDCRTMGNRICGPEQ